MREVLLLDLTGREKMKKASLESEKCMKLESSFGKNEEKMEWKYSHFSSFPIIFHLSHIFPTTFSPSIPPIVWNRICR